MEECIEPVKKRRGRKSKDPNDTIEIAQPVKKANISTDTESTTSKRGRKPKCVYSTQDAVSSIQQGSLSDDENIIVRLNVVDTVETPNGENADLLEDEHPYAYNRDDYSNMSNSSFQHYNISGCSHEGPQSTADGTTNHLRVVNVLKDFEEKNKVNEWPSNTSICCYWCCHRFDNAPYGIPVNFVNDNFDVFGCFCSLECAAAYNFKMNDYVDEMWERYNLLNLLFRRMNFGTVVKAAPDRLALKIFGGYMDIDEFRAFFKSNKMVNVNFPPMSSLTQQIEEVNEHEINSEFKYIPLDQERIEKYKAKIMFKRVKPLIDNKNSIESSMNLKYSTDT
jgi:hypothetical protein